MRRAMLLTVGVGAGGMVLLVLCLRVAAVIAPATNTEIVFPIAVEGTFLEVLTPACYEGLFYEDGSDRPVTDVAAIVVKNVGGCYVDKGTVIMDWGEDRYIFELSWLPPGEKALLLEKDAKVFAPHEEASFYGWTIACFPEQTGMVSVAAAGDTQVSLYNQTGTELPEVTLYYKHYNVQSGMYIGGITYSYTVSQLPPGQGESVSLSGYVDGYSRIVCVLASG